MELLEQLNLSDELSVSPRPAGVVTVTAANTQLTTEEVQDIVGGMVSGNTETNITVSYDDTGGKLNFVASGGSVPANLTADTLDVVGIVTAGSFVTDLITANGSGRGFCTRYYVTANGFCISFCCPFSKKYCRQPNSLLDERIHIYV